MTNKASLIVMTPVGDEPNRGASLWTQFDALPAPPGFCWRFVPEGPFAVQFRSILRMDASAVVVVCAGAQDAVKGAAKLISRLLGAGLPSVIAIAQVHDPWRESVLRQAGALYICANEAQQRLGDVLESILPPPSHSMAMESVESTREVNMNAS